MFVLFYFSKMFSHVLKICCSPGLECFPAIVAQQPAIVAQQPATETGQPAIAAQQPAIVTQQPATVMQLAC